MYFEMPVNWHYLPTSWQTADFATAPNLYYFVFYQQLVTRNIGCVALKLLRFCYKTLFSSDLLCFSKKVCVMHPATECMNSLRRDKRPRCVGIEDLRPVELCLLLPEVAIEKVVGGVLFSSWAGKGGIFMLKASVVVHEVAVTNSLYLEGAFSAQ